MHTHLTITGYKSACLVLDMTTFDLQEELFIKFAEFEERCKEHDRARAIYRYALDHIPKNQADAVYQRFVAFEKQHGDREGIEVCPPFLYRSKRSLSVTFLPAVMCEVRV